MKMDKFCMMFFVIVASIFFISGSASAQAADCIECSSCTLFEMWKFICTFIGQICTMQGLPANFCLEQQEICEDNIDALVTECEDICQNDCNNPVNCSGGAPDGNCTAGENCPADATDCDDNICMEPTCTNGCGETPVPVNETDEACNASAGCTTPPCSCDGQGNCATVPVSGCHGHGNPDWLELQSLPTVLAKEKGCTGNCGTEYLVELRSESHADCGDQAWVWIKDGQNMDIDKCYHAAVFENSAPCGPVIDVTPDSVSCPVCEGQMEECEIEIEFTQNGIYKVGETISGTHKFYVNGVLTDYDSIIATYHKEEGGPTYDYRGSITHTATGTYVAEGRARTDIIGSGTRIVNVEAEFGNCEEEAASSFCVYDTNPAVCGGNGSTPTCTSTNCESSNAPNIPCICGNSVTTPDYQWCCASESYVTSTKDNCEAICDGGTKKITVLSPNGGETCYIDEVCDFTWSSTGVTGTVKIDLYKGGNYYRSIDSSVPVSDRTTLRIIPTSIPAGNDYRVKITSNEDGSINDISNGDFTISSGGGGGTKSITVLSPNGGQSWKIGETHDFTWSSTGVSGDVKVYLCKGTFSRLIASNAPASYGRVSREIPTNIPTGSGYKVKITSRDDGSITDMSNGDFTISSGGGASTCTESDSGRDYETGSYCDGSPFLSGNDHCNTQTGELTEYYCVAGSDTCHAESVDCDTYCKNKGSTSGKCEGFPAACKCSGGETSCTSIEGGTCMTYSGACDACGGTQITGYCESGFCCKCGPKLCSAAGGKCMSAVSCQGCDGTQITGKCDSGECCKCTSGDCEDDEGGTCISPAQCDACGGTLISGYCANYPCCKCG